MVGGYKYGSRAQMANKKMKVSQQIGTDSGAGIHRNVKTSRVSDKALLFESQSDVLLKEVGCKPATTQLYQ